MGFAWVHLPGNIAPVALLVATLSALCSGCLPGLGAMTSKASSEANAKGSIQGPSSSYTAERLGSVTSTDTASMGQSFYQNSPLLSPLAVGLQHTCFIAPDEVGKAAVFCNGLNEFEQIAPHSEDEILVSSNASPSVPPLVRVLVKPVKLVLPTDAIPNSVAVGFGHTCVLYQSDQSGASVGKLLCLGQTDHGATGLNGLEDVYAVAARGQWSCAIKKAVAVDELWCAGTGLEIKPDGKTGPLRFTGVKSLVAQFAKGQVVSMHMSNGHLIVATGNRIYGFGINSSGEAGADLVSSPNVETMREILYAGSSGAKFVSVVTSDERTLVTQSDGKVLAFGRSLGDRDLELPLYEIVKSPYVANFWAALKSEVREMTAAGAMVAQSGKAYYGAYTFGDGKPKEFAYGVQTVRYSEGDQNGCVLFKSGCVACWGFNGFGQMGVDSIDYQERFMNQPALVQTQSKCALR